jgi:hypothetical protein
MSQSASGAWSRHCPFCGSDKSCWGKVNADMRPEDVVYECPVCRGKFAIKIHKEPKFNPAGDQKRRAKFSLSRETHYLEKLEDENGTSACRKWVGRAVLTEERVTCESCQRAVGA